MDKNKIILILRNIAFVIAVVLVTCVIRTLIKPVIVHGQSMVPTYHENQYVIGHWFVNIDRFDVVVIDVDDLQLIKRVIGLPGETIMYKDNQLYVNNTLVEDTYGNGNTADFMITLGENEYFCMGDNREHSIDSRSYGAFNYDQIVSKMNWN